MLVSAVGPRKLVLVVFVTVCLLFLSLRSSFYTNYLDDRVVSLENTAAEKFAQEAQQEHFASEDSSPAQDAPADADAEWHQEYAFPSSAVSMLLYATASSRELTTSRSLRSKPRLRCFLRQPPPSPRPKPRQTRRPAPAAAAGTSSRMSSRRTPSRPSPKRRSFRPSPTCAST